MVRSYLISFCSHHERILGIQEKVFLQVLRHIHRGRRAFTDATRDWSSAQGQQGQVYQESVQGWREEKERSRGGEERDGKGGTGKLLRTDGQGDTVLMRCFFQAAQAAFAQDVSAGHAKATAPIASSSSTAPKPPPKPSNPFSNYSTAASLGFTDPDAERLAAEAESRRTQGVAGNWEYVEAPTAQSKETDSLKREAETPAEEWDTREFKLRKKTLGTGLGQIYDPGIIPVKLKAKEEPAGDSKDNIIMTASSNANSNPPNATDAPKWTKTQWKRPGERVKEEEEEAGTGSEQIKQEEEAQADKDSDGTATPMADGQSGDQAVKPEPGLTDTVKVETMESAPPAPAPGGGMFRKRKAPAGGARGRRDI